MISEPRMREIGCQTPPHHRYRSQRLACLAATALVAAALSSVPSATAKGGPSITIRLLNATSGKPVKDAVLLAYAPKEQHEASQGEQERLLAYARTNANGVAVLRIPGPTREIVVSYGDPLLVGRCSPWSPFVTDEILRTGVIAANTCSGRKFEYTAAPKPGELVLFGKKWSWWERMKHSE